MKLGIAMLVVSLVLVISGFLIWGGLTYYPYGEELARWLGIVAGLWGLGAGLSIGGIVRIIGTR